MRRLLLTCEHAGNRVPARYASLFQAARALLAGHRGYDPGALEIARSLARRAAAPLLYSDVTRLLVELNRSAKHAALFSEFSRKLDADEKERILRRYYRPHRERVEQWIASAVETGDGVLHVSVHTFTPELDGEVRRADIGLLYDPRRPSERDFARRWKDALRAARPDLRIRSNYPYLGKADGLTTHLRRRFDDAAYAGVELEVNQRWLDDRREWKKLIGALESTLPT